MSAENYASVEEIAAQVVVAITQIEKGIAALQLCAQEFSAAQQAITDTRSDDQELYRGLGLLGAAIIHRGAAEEKADAAMGAIRTYRQRLVGGEPAATTENVRPKAAAPQPQDKPKTPPDTPSTPATVPATKPVETKPAVETNTADRQDTTPPPKPEPQTNTPQKPEPQTQPTQQSKPQQKPPQSPQQKTAEQKPEPAAEHQPFSAVADVRQVGSSEVKVVLGGYTPDSTAAVAEQLADCEVIVVEGRGSGTYEGQAQESRDYTAMLSSQHPDPQALAAELRQSDNPTDQLLSHLVGTGKQVVVVALPRDNLDYSAIMRMESERVGLNTAFDRSDPSSVPRALGEVARATERVDRAVNQHREERIAQLANLVEGRATIGVCAVQGQYQLAKNLGTPVNAEQSAAVIARAEQTLSPFDRYVNRVTTPGDTGSMDTRGVMGPAGQGSAAFERASMAAFCNHYVPGDRQENNAKIQAMDAQTRQFFFEGIDRAMDTRSRGRGQAQVQQFITTFMSSPQSAYRELPPGHSS